MQVARVQWPPERTVKDSDRHVATDNSGINAGAVLPRAHAACHIKERIDCHCRCTIRRYASRRKLE
eukprot:4605496-Amphidinium_carterae.1